MLGAAVDVGSNSIRLLIGERGAEGVSPLRYHRKITRLAGGLVPKGGLSAEACSRTLDALQEMAEIVARYPVAQVRVVGTEALRKAVNCAELVEAVARRTGWRLEVVSGDEEARLSAAGARAALHPLPDDYLLFDIGGGSTEFIFQSGSSIQYHRSFPIGVVGLAERFQDGDKRRAFIDEILNELQTDLAHTQLLSKLRQSQTVLVGTAGTVTTLAAMQLRMAEYDWRRINNHQLDDRYLSELQSTLEALSPEQRLELPGLEAGREDLIVPGLEVVRAVIALSGGKTLKVSDFGLLEGILLSL